MSSTNLPPKVAVREERVGERLAQTERGAPYFERFGSGRAKVFTPSADWDATRAYGLLPVRPGQRHATIPYLIAADLNFVRSTREGGRVWEADWNWVDVRTGEAVSPDALPPDAREPWRWSFSVREVTEKVNRDANGRPLVTPLGEPRGPFDRRVPKLILSGRAVAQEFPADIFSLAGTLNGGPVVIRGISFEAGTLFCAGPAVEEGEWGTNPDTGQRDFSILPEAAVSAVLEWEPEGHQPKSELVGTVGYLDVADLVQDDTGAERLVRKKTRVTARDDGGRPVERQLTEEGYFQTDPPFDPETGLRDWTAPEEGEPVIVEDELYPTNDFSIFEV